MNIPGAEGAGATLARKKGSTYRKTIRNRMKNPKPTTLGKSSRSKLNNTKKAARQREHNKMRNPKEIVYRKLESYKNEANTIYNNEELMSIEKAKGLLTLIEKLYYRMPTPKLKELVQVEIDINTLAENIHNTYDDILNKLKEETRGAIIMNVNNANKNENENENVNEENDNANVNNLLAGIMKGLGI